jgi:hypothetical protein
MFAVWPRGIEHLISHGGWQLVYQPDVNGQLPFIYALENLDPEALV